MSLSGIDNVRSFLRKVWWSWHTVLKSLQELLSRKSLRELITLGRSHLGLYGFFGTLKRLLSRIRNIARATPDVALPQPLWLANARVSLALQEQSREGDKKQEEPCSQQPQHSELAATPVLKLPEEVLSVKVSVVIPTKNGIAEDFESTLHMIYTQKGIATIEVVVIDSGSSDDTVGVAESYGAKVYKIPPQVFNHGTTRNYGAEQSTGELIVFMTQDAIPATEDLFYLMAKEVLADPTLAAVSVRQIPKSNADMYACWEAWSYYKSLFGRPLPQLGTPEKIARLSTQELRRLAAVDNVCAIVKRRIWEKIRFKSTMFGEDLAFGLSCLKDGYRIGLLPHCAVIHSHTRPAFYHLARSYVERRVLLGLFSEDRTRWTKILTHDQLFTCMVRLYLLIAEFSRSIETSSRYDPVKILRELLLSISGANGTIHRSGHQHGDQILDQFFNELGKVFNRARPHVDPCLPGFRWRINSLVELAQAGYPLVSGRTLLDTIYKAYAGVAGSLWGEFCFWESQNGTLSGPAEKLDSLLTAGMRR